MSEIRVLVVDDHAAVRAGLQALIDAEPDMHAVGEAHDEYTLMPAMRRYEPDVVVLDYQLAGANGLVLCRRIKASRRQCGVVVYSAFAAPTMLVPAWLAEADAVVDKAVRPRELAATIRRVAAGQASIPDPTPEALAVAGELLLPDDLPILGMMTNGVTAREVVDTLDISAEELDERIERILGVLA